MSAVLIAGTHSGCGKTTVTLGLIAALVKKGFSVQPFKVGPDFIDTGLHTYFAKRPSRNLDLWMCGEEYIRQSFYKNASTAQISIIEGVMGLYDGIFSTAHVARLLKVPVILVIDAYGMAESIGALVKGFMEYSDENLIKGVILNRISSESHLRRLKKSIGESTVIGYLPRDLQFEIPSRHLGLMVAQENPLSDKSIERLISAVENCINIERIFEIAKSCEVLQNSFDEKVIEPFCKIAVAYDKAFCFYYKDNFDILEKEGAQIVFFSPLNDKTLPPDIQCIYIGGGYPELYAQALSENKEIIREIRNWIDDDKPLYAECGGLIYLSKGVFDKEGKFFELLGALPFEVIMQTKPVLGYRKVKINKKCILGNKGDSLRGHEFHYSKIKTSKATDLCYELYNSDNVFIGIEGYRTRNLLSSYVHIHFGSNPKIGQNFIKYIGEKNGKNYNRCARKSYERGE